MPAKGPGPGVGPLGCQDSMQLRPESEDRQVQLSLVAGQKQDISLEFFMSL